VAVVVSSIPSRQTTKKKYLSYRRKKPLLRPRVSENMVLWRIFGLKGDEMTVGWRKLHNEELHNL
jgi:hypothetical protein